MNDFEKILSKDIIKSISEHPELWSTSIMGLMRNDGLELNIGGVYNTVSIYHPYEYKFKESNIEKEVFNAVNNLRQLIYEEKKNKIEIENKNKLADFLNLNTRKNKLEHLDLIQNRKSKLEQLDKIEKKSESFFNKIFNIFKY